MTTDDKIVKFKETLFYCDGPQVFEAVDDYGHPYIGVEISPENGKDRCLINMVNEEDMQKFKDGTIDLRSLCLSSQRYGWYRVWNIGVHDENNSTIHLHPQSSRIEASEYLPKEGFFLKKGNENETIVH